MTYRMETITLLVKSVNRLNVRITKGAIERMTLDVRLRYHIRNEEVRARSKVGDDVIQCTASLKLSWIGHVSRQGNCRWVRRIVHWRPRSAGRPKREWIDDIKESSNWYQLALNRSR